VIVGGARARVDASRCVVLDAPGALRGSDDAGLFANVAAPLFCVDGNNLLWRAAHGHPAPFTATDGGDLTPLFRFFSMLRRALGSWGVFHECVVCFDGAEAWGTRLRIDPAYKANRSYEDKDLSFMRWLPEIHAALASAGIASIEVQDQEADDVIATLAARAGDRRVRIVSTDRDYFQLLSGRCDIVNTRCSPPVVDAEAVRAAYGVGPDRWCDFRALAGDPSDGIAGVAGIGPKRAAALLADGASLEDLCARGAVPEDVLRWRELIRLRTDVPLDVELSGAPSPKMPSATVVCRELGLI